MGQCGQAIGDATDDGNADRFRVGRVDDSHSCQGNCCCRGEKPLAISRPALPFERLLVRRPHRRRQNCCIWAAGWQQTPVEWFRWHFRCQHPATVGTIYVWLLAQLNDLSVPGDLRRLERSAVNVDHLLFFQKGPSAARRASCQHSFETVDVDLPGVGGRNELSRRDRGRCNQRGQVERPERQTGVGPERNKEPRRRRWLAGLKQINLNWLIVRIADRNWYLNGRLGLSGTQRNGEKS